MNRRQDWLALPLLLVMGAPACGAAFSGEMQSRTVSVGGATYNYRVYLPADYSKERRWPVILFLHGAGERGSDNEKQTRVGLGPAIAGRADFPFVVVMPQCPTNRWWPEPDMQAIAVAALDQAMAEFNGDPERVYLTGISMGGYGTWAIAAANPGRFAALAPVCGGIRPPMRVNLPQTGLAAAAGDPYEAAARLIGSTPVWVFHGAADPIVPVSESQKMVAALKAAGGNVKYSEYAGVGHNSWDRAYAEPGFAEWLLSHKKTAAPAASKQD